MQSHALLASDTLATRCPPSAGISPVGLEAMASSFNCAFDLSALAPFNGAVGFSEADVRRAVVECLGYAMGSREQRFVVDTLKQWANGYRFAAGLSSTKSMYQSAMVLQLLTELSATNWETRLHGVKLQRWLSSWIPSGAVGTEVEDQLLAYYSHSGGMDRLLPQLVASERRAIAPPHPLSALRVEEQVAAAHLPAAPGARDQVLLDAWAVAATEPLRGDIGSSSSSSVATFSTEGADAEAEAASHLAAAQAAEKTLLRTLYFDGLVTHAVHGSAAGAGLLVPTNSMRRRFVDRFARVLRADPRKPRAVDAFLLRGETEDLQASLADVCRRGLSKAGLLSWSEHHYAERLVLLLSASSLSSFRWQRQEPTPRLYSKSNPCYPGFADIVGTSGAGNIIIEVNQVNVAFDLEREHMETSLSERIRDTATLLQQQFPRAQPHGVKELAVAEALSTLPEESLLSVRISKPVGGSGLRRQLTIEQLQAEGAAQVQQYARGWARKNKHLPSKGLRLYTAVAVGPLRWLLRSVPVPGPS